MPEVWLRIKQFCLNFWQGILRARSLTRKQLVQVFDAFNWTERFLIIAALLIFVLSGGFLLANIFSGHSPGSHYGGSITEGLVGQPQFINPVLAVTNDVDSDLSRIVYAQLLKYDANQNLTPDLAEALPQISKDQKTYTLKLRSNLKWQDGQPLNADDVIYTIQTIQNSDFQSPLRPNWERVKITKVDNLTITFTLPEIQASFMDNFALGILPKHIWGSLSSQNFRQSAYNLNPVGSGPFIFDSFKKNMDGSAKSLSLKPNNNYYDGRPYLDSVTFKFYDSFNSLINAYQAREITSLGINPLSDKAFIAQSDKYNQYQINLPQYQAVFFNLQKDTPLSDKAVRQALWLTTNRQDIINNVYSGQGSPIYTPILPDELGYDADIAKTVHESVSEASGILDKAGWTMDPSTNLRSNNNQPLEFSLAVNGDSPLDVQTAQTLQAQWQRVGAKVNLMVMNSSDLEQNSIRPRNFDALLFSENVGADPDPFPFWAGSQIHDPGLNLSGFSDPTTDKLLTQARQTTDPTVRTNDYVQFQQIVNDEIPAIFLVQSLYIYNVPKKIQGINLAHIIDPSERFLDIAHWYEND